MKKETLLVIAFWLMIGSLGLNLFQGDKALGATPVLRPFQGGTGTGTAPSYGQVLVGDSSGIYTLMSTSSLNITAGSADWATLGYPFPSNATTSVLTFTNGLLAGTSTFLGATTTFAGDISMSHPFQIVTHGLRGDASDGIYFVSNNGTAVANFGVGNSANSVFNGGVNVTGVTGANGGLTFTQATGTNVYASASSTFQVLNAGTLTMPSLTLGALGVNSSGLVYKFATTTFSTGLTYTNGNVTCDVASGSQAGCLASADWTTFNGKESALTFSAPLTRSGNTVGAYVIGTSTVPTAGQLAYWNSARLLTSVATGTISATSPLSVTASRYAIGGAAAFSWDFSVANTWTGLQTFSNAGGFISLASSTAQNFNSASSTITTLLNTNGTSTNYYVSGQLVAPIDRTILMSSSTMGTGTSTKKLTGYNHGATISAMGCNAVGTGTFNAAVGDGTATSSYIVSSTGLTTSFTTLSANNTFTTGEAIFVAFGNVSGAVADPNCTITIR